MIRTITFLLVMFILTSGTRAQTVNDTTEIIFADNFSDDTVGKLPGNWMFNSDCEIVTLKKYPGKWLKMYSPGTYLPQINHSLPPEFNVEFDFIFDADRDNYNTTEVTIFENPDSLPADELFPGKKGIHLNLEDYIVSYICYNKENSGEQISGENRINAIRKNERARVKISLHDQTARVLINGNEILSIAVPAKATYDNIRFHLWGSTAEPLVSNLKIWSEK